MGLGPAIPIAGASNGMTIEMLPADLTEDDDLARAEAGRRADARRAMMLKLSTR
ncbi:MAG TPA: hypothetical protein PLV07_13145 [Acidiphilium sp.]|uniref:hypothetical protein n=1 Tax=unclassified Acidiphilium TaxID=2617493 RepID=UPI0025B89F46|nr:MULTISPECIES: hypothetical protein [unclassified Acidiphilium]HQT61893.1 hypothetical protein [Acidiphilium sp.]HQU12517.1 hypothetical protein [Acidiphilium sp.]